MQPLLSEISFVMVTDLLPKKSYKNTTRIGFPIQKKNFPIFVQFPWLNELLEQKEHHWKQVRFKIFK